MQTRPKQSSNDEPRRSKTLAQRIEKVMKRISPIGKHPFMRACGAAIDTFFNPLTLQTRYLVRQYPGRSPAKWQRAAKVALVFACLPAGTFIGLEILAAVAPASALVSVLACSCLGLCLFNGIQHMVVGKKCAAVVEDTNEAGQRVSGKCEDLCRLELTQRLINDISCRFNYYATPPAVTTTIDAIISLSNPCRNRVTVVNAGAKDAGKKIYEFAGNADSASKTKKIITLMTDGAPRAMTVSRPLRFKSKPAAAKAKDITQKI